MRLAWSSGSSPPPLSVRTPLAVSWYGRLIRELHEKSCRSLRDSRSLLFICSRRRSWAPLGAHAHAVVHFYGRISVAKEPLRRVNEIHMANLSLNLSTEQTLDIGKALLQAAEAGVQASPTFASAPWGGGEQIFAQEVAAARKACYDHWPA